MLTTDGEEVGRVTGFFETGAVDVLVVLGREGERLMPLAPYVKVDPLAGRIVVDPPEGHCGRCFEGTDRKGGSSKREARTWRQSSRWTS